MVERLHRNRKGRGFESCRGLKFFSGSNCNSFSYCITALITFSLIHLLLFITAKYAFICANRQSIKRINIHLHEAAIIYAKRTHICEFCMIVGIQLHFWSFNCAFGHSKKNNKLSFHAGAKPPLRAVIIFTDFWLF